MKFQHSLTLLAIISWPVVSAGNADLNRESGMKRIAQFAQDAKAGSVSVKEGAEGMLGALREVAGEATEIPNEEIEALRKLVHDIFANMTAMFVQATADDAKELSLIFAQFSKCKVADGQEDQQAIVDFSKEEHKKCRVLQVQLFDHHARATKDIKDQLSEMKPTATEDQHCLLPRNQNAMLKPPREEPLKEWYKFFESGQRWYGRYHDRWMENVKNYKDFEKKLSEQMVACNLKQGVFENDFCYLKLLIEGNCDYYDDCWSATEDRWGVRVKVAGDHALLRGGDCKLMHQIQCILDKVFDYMKANNDGTTTGGMELEKIMKECEDKDYSDTCTFNNYPELGFQVPPKGECDTSSVSVYPGHEGFEELNYLDAWDTAKAPYDKVEPCLTYESS